MLFWSISSLSEGTAFAGEVNPWAAALVLNGENSAPVDPANALDMVYYGRHGGVTLRHAAVTQHPPVAGIWIWMTVWMGTFGRGGTRRADRRIKQRQLDQVIPIPPYPHAATQGIEVGKAKDCPRPLRDDGGKMKSIPGTVQHPHQAGKQETVKPSSAAQWIPTEVGQTKGTGDHSHHQLPKGTKGTSNKPACVHQPQNNAGDGMWPSQQAPLVLCVTASNSGPITWAHVPRPLWGCEHDRVSVILPLWVKLNNLLFLCCLVSSSSTLAQLCCKLCPMKFTSHWDAVTQRQGVQRKRADCRKNNSLRRSVHCLETVTELVSGFAEVCFYNTLRRVMIRSGWFLYELQPRSWLSL